MGRGNSRIATPRPDSIIKIYKSQCDHMENVWHLSLGSFFALAGGLSLIFEWPFWIPVLVVVGIDIYLVLVLIEVARRSGGNRKMLELPDKTWSLLQLVFVLIAVVCSFGELCIF